VLLLASLLALAVRSCDPSNSYRAPIVQQPGQRSPHRDYRGPIIVGGNGFIMLMFAGRSKAGTEKVAGTENGFFSTNVPEIGSRHAICPLSGIESYQ